MAEKLNDQNQRSIQGDVNTGGGDFIGRDKNIQLGEKSVLVEGDLHISLNAPEKQRLANLLPAPPALFIGREADLSAIKEYLSYTEPDAANLLAVRGWPGIGKTTLAKALAHDKTLSRLFPDGILWAELGAHPNLLGVLAGWARALGAEALLQADDLEQARNLLASLLQDKRILLIVDDIWQTEHAQPFFVSGKKGAILLTTRINDVARKLASPSQIYALAGLSDTESLRLLTKITPAVVADYPDETLELVRALEGLPLAIQVAGRLLESERSLGFSVVDLLEELKSETHILEAEAPPDRADLINETTPTVAALLYKSIEKLDDTIRDYYAYLGVFAPKPATFDLDAMKFVWDVDDPKPIIRILEGRGLLDILPNGRYQMHALLVLLAKTLLDD